MRRGLAVSLGFSGHYQDIGISSLKRHDAACNFILSVVLQTRSRGGIESTFLFFFLPFFLAACKQCKQRKQRKKRQQKDFESGAFGVS